MYQLNHRRAKTRFHLANKAIGQLHQDMAANPSFDSVKVAAIKEAIANGSYTVDPEKLADNMIKFENELKGL